MVGRKKSFRLSFLTFDCSQRDFMLVSRASRLDYVSFTNSYAEKVVMFTYHRPLLTSLMVGTFTFIAVAVIDVARDPSSSPGSVALISGVAAVILSACAYTCFRGIPALENNCCLPETKRKVRMRNEIQQLRASLSMTSPVEHMETVEKMIAAATRHQVFNSSETSILPAFLPIFKDSFAGACSRGYLASIHLLLDFLAKNPQMRDFSYDGKEFEEMWNELLEIAKINNRDAVILAMASFAAKHDFLTV